MEYLADKNWCCSVARYMNENVPKIKINNTINIFLNCNQHFGDVKP